MGTMVNFARAAMTVAVVMAACARRNETTGNTLSAAASSTSVDAASELEAPLRPPLAATEVGKAPSVDAAADGPEPPTAFKPCPACGGAGFCFEIQCPTFFVLDPPGAGSAYPWHWGERATLVTYAYILEPEDVQARCAGEGRTGLIAKGAFPAKGGRPAGCFLTGKIGNRIWYDRWWGSVGFTLEYDTSLKTYFDPIIERMAATFRTKPRDECRDAEP